MQKRFIFIAILILTLSGGFLRFYDLTKNPPSLNIDEVSVGYNAYSILKTGRDEHSQFLPLAFKSIGDYKPPVSIYLTVPSIALFGLNEFAVRFPAAFISTLSIPIYYFFFVNFIRNIKIALLATALLTISPWYIYYSRYAASEFLLSTLLASLGILSFLKMLSGKIIWGVLSALALVLSMYTYHTERLFVPLFILVFALLYKKTLLSQKRICLTFLMTLFMLVIPLIFTLIGPGNIRAEETFIARDINFTRNVAVKPLQDLSFFSSEIFLLIFYWIRKYLAYFQPSFLFFNGLNMTTTGTLGLGIMYLFEIPFLILGIINLIKDKIINKGVIITWILLGILPASLTINEQHPSRTLIVLPMIALISAIGGVSFFKLMKEKISGLARLGIYFLYSGLVIWNLMFAFLVFSIHFPRQKAEAFMDGTKQTVEYALTHKDKYQEIVFDPSRGIEAPYIVSIPHMYVLFYSQYDPAKYQRENKVRPDGSFGFNKFTIRPIDWRVDRATKQTLFIGSPWSLPEKDIKPEEILKRVYMSDGNLAFLIVSPK